MRTSEIIKVARSSGGFKNTILTEWVFTPTSLVKAFELPQIGEKDGSYFLRCCGTHRSNKYTADTASILILDGDSRITELVHSFLTSLGVSHVIYTSHSNYVGLHKYRTLIPCEYSRPQLPILLNHFHELLHEEGVMLFNVTENRTWAQAWYFPRVPDHRRLELFRCFNYLEGGDLDAEEICKEYLAEHPDEMTAEKVETSNYKAFELKADQNYINPITLFNAAWKSPVNYLQTQGYRVKGNRLIHPGSQSGVAGVFICHECNDGVERIFSHGGDLLNDGFAHDAFDCYRILEHGGDIISALKVIGRTWIVNGRTVEQLNQSGFRSKAASKPLTPVNFSGLGGLL